MKEVKKIDKFSLAKIVALFCGIDGFILAFIVSILMIINIIRQPDFAGSVILVILFNFGIGLLLVILLSLIFAGIGWIAGWLMAIFYNIFALKFGGIKIDLVEIEDKKLFVKDIKEDIKEDIK